MRAHSAITALVLLASSTYGSDTSEEPSKSESTAEAADKFRWENPFISDAIASFEPSCESTASFNALQLTLADVMQPAPDVLKSWASELQALFSGEEYEYPGTWADPDQQHDDRVFLLMEYVGLPTAVQEWFRGQVESGGQGKDLFNLISRPVPDDAPDEEKTDQDGDEQKVVIFTPGAVYRTLPLWAAEESECRDTLLDLTRYKSKPEEGAVVAWVENSRPERMVVPFQVKAQVLKRASSSSEESSQTVEDGQEGANAEETSEAQSLPKDEL